MARVEFRFLDREDVNHLLPSMHETIALVEEGLAAPGRGEVVLPPKAHIDLDDRYNGHFNVLPGWAAHVDTAGVKIVGDYESVNQSPHLLRRLLSAPCGVAGTPKIAHVARYARDFVHPHGLCRTRSGTVSLRWEIACGRKPGRTGSEERIVFWHRGFAISDIVVGRALLERAEAQGKGKLLVLFDQEDE